MLSNICMYFINQFYIIFLQVFLSIVLFINFYVSDYFIISCETKLDYVMLILILYPGFNFWNAYYSV